MEKANEFSKIMSNKDNQNSSNIRINNNLSLRKKKLNDVLSKRRNIKDIGLTEYQLKMEDLKIDDNLKIKVYQMEDFIKEMKIQIKSNNLENNKYALLCLRKQTIEKNTMENKKVFIDRMIKEDFISDILNIMSNNLNNKQILYEGLWILINFTYYETDIIESRFFLSNEICINLYIKICQTNDINLRGSVYWLLCNIIENNYQYAYLIKILRNVYMSPLLREYVLFDIENRKDLSDSYEDLILRILSRTSEIVNEIICSLKENDIKEYTKINPNVNYNNLKENNDYLFAHIFEVFLKKINVKNYSSLSIYALSKLTNHLENKEIFNLFMLSGVFRKLIKGEIEINEDDFSNAIQIVGNYLNFVDDYLLDKIIVEEICKFLFTINQRNPSSQYLKRDIFWTLSNLTVGPVSSNQSFANSGLLLLALQTLNSENEYNECVISEILITLINFFDIQNLDVIINFYSFDYMKSLCECLKNWRKNNSEKMEINEEGLIDKLISCIGSLIDIGEFCKQQCNANKFYEDLEKYGGLEVLESILSEHNFEKNLSEKIEIILSKNK